MMRRKLLGLALGLLGVVVLAGWSPVVGVRLPQFQRRGVATSAD
jgi:hypothetical protein